MRSIKTGVIAVYCLALAIQILGGVSATPTEEWGNLEYIACAIGIAFIIGSAILILVCVAITAEEEGQDEDNRGTSETFQP